MCKSLQIFLGREESFMCGGRAWRGTSMVLVKAGFDVTVVLGRSSDADFDSSIMDEVKGMEAYYEILQRDLELFFT